MRIHRNQLESIAVHRDPLWCIAIKYDQKWMRQRNIICGKPEQILPRCGISPQPKFLRCGNRRSRSCRKYATILCRHRQPQGSIAFRRNFRAVLDPKYHSKIRNFEKGTPLVDFQSRKKTFYIIGRYLGVFQKPFSGNPGIPSWLKWFWTQSTTVNCSSLRSDLDMAMKPTKK